MAPSKLAVVVALVASLLLVTTSNTKAAPGTYPPRDPPPHQIVDPAKDCGGACDVRCGAHSRKNICTRACLKCCGVCRCVPAGTAGNQQTCGKCYTDWTTHGNKTKCP
ncbi:Gibberellin-regulated protein 14 [Zea mays]|uniref:Gibberellin-regulated protein 14 n=1 Tax=Zea mays TaxID=4577 RepID=A0A3L6G4Q2_MAIZE|nr:Gibberellin-regulated protein 14 [Zea mays]